MRTPILSALFVGVLAFSGAAVSQSLITKAVESDAVAPVSAQVQTTVKKVEGLKSSLTETVNINSASVRELAAALKGVGPKKAAAIVAFRDLHGPFQHVEELEEVKGIGAILLAKNKDKLALK